ncbi:glycosyltransferase family A protein [Actinoplanes oblitus]|uniref:Glycosyltransferase family A protein n=1 Tax=Actinoplanes oblitus TaxID=3040509 RepID=A0ABY8WCD6_9ACTN|nr:glycosyltransferase family A protein [Actinoplanes oblitus]WIM95470.1 glycosyltransferase family A protein [Actinoplanes oblitus]
MIGEENPAALVAAAVRNRAIGVREELASGDLAGLLHAARTGRRPALARPDLVAVLAQVMALQDVLPSDRADALALFEMLGARRVPARQRNVYAQLARSPRIAVDRQVRHEIATDLANPFREPGRPLRPWLRRFGAGLPGPALRLAGSAHLPPFDRLCTDDPTPVERPELITVVVTAHRPGEGLLTAVRSILRQSWRNLEVLVVDDASPPEFDAVLARAVALDPRVRLLRQPVNGGTYVARNAGLDAAAGDFVTFQDSDDWSHPRRLELQVTPLLDDPGLVASTSDGRRVTEDLTLTRLGRRGGKLNPSALLIRKAAVLRRAGYFDVVRKGGDSEYIDRITAAFGERAVRHLPVHLALIRLSTGSLSRAEILPYWLHPARAAYRSAYLTWHARIAAGAPAFRPRDGADRPFPAPAHLLRSASDRETTAAYDVVVAADWRFAGESQRSGLAEIEALLGRGLRVAILHLEDWRRPVVRRLPVHPAVQRLVNAGRLGAVTLPDRVDCGLLLIRQAEVVRHPPAGGTGLRPRTVMILVDEMPRGALRPCGAAAERMFRVPALWCPQSPAVRAALSDLPLTAFDLPTVALPVPARRAPISRNAVIGAEVNDPRELAALEGLTGFDVRIRAADGLRLPRQPAGRLVYRAAEVDPLEFYGQLDFALRTGPSERAALDAAVTGCITVPPGSVDVLRRYQAEPRLVAERRRQDRRRIRQDHHPDPFVDRVAAIARNAE